MSVVTKRGISLTLAFLITLTSVGFSADVHYCQGQLRSFALFGTAKSCHEKASISKCHLKSTDERSTDKKTCSVDSNDCCNNYEFAHAFDYDAPNTLISTQTDAKSKKESVSKALDNRLQYRSNYTSNSKFKPPENKNFNKATGIHLRIQYQSFLC